MGWLRRARKQPADPHEPPFPPAFRRLLLEAVRRAPRATYGVDCAGPARQRTASRSGTFAGHRSYGRGDEVRDVDWHAYARTRALFAKVVEEEERRTLTQLVDLSPSQDAGTPPRRLATLRFAALYGALALARLDALHLVHGDGRALTLRGAASLEALLQSLAAAPRAHAPLAMVQRPLEEGWAGRWLWISDFVPPDAVAPALALLRRHGRRCVGILPEIADDRGTDLLGVVALRDPESGARAVVRVDRDLQRAFADELAALRRAQDAVFRGAGFALQRVPVPADFAPASWAFAWAPRRSAVEFAR